MMTHDIIITPKHDNTLSNKVVMLNNYTACLVDPLSTKMNDVQN